MAASGYTPILSYGSTTASAVPLAANLTTSASGVELAVNAYDGKLFYKDAGGTVQVLGVKMPSGILPIANGGTNSSATPTAGALAYGTGTAYGFTAAGSSGQVLTSAGSGTPTWTSLSSIGVTTFSAGTTGFTPSTATSGAVTLAGTLATTNGGTGLTSFTANGVVYASSTSALATGSALTFDGTNLGIGQTAYGPLQVKVNSATSIQVRANATNTEARVVATDPANTVYTPLFLDGSYTGFNVSGNEQMRLTSTGLGIGTSSVTNPLIINKNGVDAGLGIYNIARIRDGSNNKGLSIGYLAGSNTTVFTSESTGAATAFGWEVYSGSAWSQAMTLDSSGNLGLGVTPSAWGSGITALEFAKSTSISSHTTNGNIFVNANTYYNGSNWIYLNTFAATQYQQYNGAHKWYTAPSGTAGNPITFTQAMTLDSSGNLLVGRTARLNTERVSVTQVAGADGIALTDATNYTAWWNITTAGSYLVSNGKLLFGAGTDTSGAAKMTLDTSGNLGLGVTPSAWGSAFKAMQIGTGGAVWGSTSATEVNIGGNARVDANNAQYDYINTGAASQYQQSAGTHVWKIAPSGTAGTAITFTQAMTLDASGNLLVGTTTGANARIRIDYSGQSYGLRVGTTAASGTAIQFVYEPSTQVGTITTTTTSTAYNTSSDYRLKNIIGPITNSGAYIDSLNPVEGTWKADGSTFVGLIAHEVQEVSRTNVATGVKDGPEMQGMDYSSAEIITNLIAEVKSLRARLAAAGIA